MIARLAGRICSRAAAWIEWRWDSCWHTACDRTGRVRPEMLSAAIRLAVAAVRAT